MRKERRTERWRMRPDVLVLSDHIARAIDEGHVGVSGTLSQQHVVGLAAVS